MLKEIRVNETEVKDNEGNIVISPGLKVKHKASQYEYTVDAVTQEPDGELQIILRMPEEPRFDPPREPPEVMSDQNTGRVLYEVDPEAMFVLDPDHPTDEGPPPSLEAEEYLAVPQAEFERDYEVK